MPGNSNKNVLKYSDNGKGQHTFEMKTQKPFAQFKDEVNEGLQNSWASKITSWEWTGQICKVSSLGADAEYKVVGDKASMTLNIRGFPATLVERRIVYEKSGRSLSRLAPTTVPPKWRRESRENLRKSALETYREAYANEVEAGLLIGRWQSMDEFTKVLAALTSSASAVAAWIVWQKDIAKAVWAALAGLASVVSIIHVAQKVSDRVKDWSDTQGHFVRLRTELETFLQLMKVNPNFPLGEFTERFNSYRARFGEGLGRKKVDFLSTFRVHAKADREAKEKYEALKERTNPT